MSKIQAGPDQITKSQQRFCLTTVPWHLGSSLNSVIRMRQCGWTAPMHQVLGDGNTTLSLSTSHMAPTYNMRGQAWNVHGRWQYWVRGRWENRMYIKSCLLCLPDFVWNWPFIVPRVPRVYPAWLQTISLRPCSSLGPGLPSPILYLSSCLLLYLYLCLLLYL